MLKIKSPSIDPCETCLIGSTFSLCLRRERYSKIKRSPTLGIPHAFNLASKRSYGIQSYSLNKYIKTVATIPFSCNSFCHDCNNTVSCVLCAFQKSQRIILKMFSTEAATGGVLQETLFLEIFQNSKENTCTRVSFLMKLQALGLQLY